MVASLAAIPVVVFKGPTIFGVVSECAALALGIADRAFGFTIIIRSAVPAAVLVVPIPVPVVAVPVVVSTIISAVIVTVPAVAHFRR